MTLAYVYKWTELATGKWYVGARGARGCPPDDGYICSSKVVIHGQLKGASLLNMPLCRAEMRLYK